MSEREYQSADFLDVVDDYCGGRLGDDDIRRLEATLIASEDARRLFVAYFQMHTDLEFSARARRATSAVLGRVSAEPAPASSRGVPRPAARSLPRIALPLNRWTSLAAGILIAVVAYGLGQLGSATPAPRRAASGSTSLRADTSNVAWLVNAQNCRWEGGESGMPGRDMRAGKVLRLDRGLAEIEFDRGARLILEGPAGLELISGNEARLLHGSLTARVPERARGFTVHSPRGKVVDLGTEFGLSVDDKGGTAVRVFEGTVVASPAVLGPRAKPGLTLHQDQAARIEDQAVALSARHEADDPRFVRAILPPPVVTPRARSLGFLEPVAGTLQDAEGLGVGLTHRLPGTGFGLPERDGNLRLNTKRAALELTTTRSDINTQVGLATGEYLGVRLADLGFTGAEDFAISATLPEIPGLEHVGQFGLYAGVRSDKNIRGGLISQAQPDQYVQFLVNNNDGVDSDFHKVGLLSTGDDLRLTLRRVSGAYSLVAENLTRHSSSTLAIAHPSFLDGERDLYVGLFGANTQSDMRKTLTIKEFDVKVWTVSPARSVDPDDIDRSARAAD